MIIARIDSALLSARLRVMMAQIRNPLPVYKTWSTVVVNKARANARAKGGKQLWQRIAKATSVTSVSACGAVIECLSYIGAHKETGGPIKARNKSCLTIPIHEMARGKTVELLELQGIKLFRPGKKNILATIGPNGTMLPVFALCRQTRSQRPDKWWPEPRWVAGQGLREMAWHISKRH